jgi:hypothetical protein
MAKTAYANFKVYVGIIYLTISIIFFTFGWSIPHHVHGRPGNRQQHHSRRLHSRSCPAKPDRLVFVCLSVVPTRAFLLERNVNSLLQQTFNVDVIISIPNIFHRKFSESDTVKLRETVRHVAHSNSRVHVLDGRDVGPAMKLLSPLQKMGDDDYILIIVDDDQLYTEHIVCDLLVTESVFPGHALTRMSRNFLNTCPGARDYLSLTLISEATHGEEQLRVHTPSDIVMGTSSYLVRSTYFDSNIYRYSACPSIVRSAIFLNDDLWISAHLRLNRVPVTTILSGFELSDGYVTSAPEVYRELSRRDGLWHAGGKEVIHQLALHGVSRTFCPYSEHSSSRCWIGSE